MRPSPVVTESDTFVAHGPNWAIGKVEQRIAVLALAPQRFLEDSRTFKYSVIHSLTSYRCARFGPSAAVRTCPTSNALRISATDFGSQSRNSFGDDAPEAIAVLVKSDKLSKC